MRHSEIDNEILLEEPIKRDLRVSHHLKRQFRMLVFSNQLIKKKELSFEIISVGLSNSSISFVNQLEYYDHVHSF